jgi:hypothetical protein
MLPARQAKMRKERKKEESQTRELLEFQ